MGHNQTSQIVATNELICKELFSGTPEIVHYAQNLQIRNVNPNYTNMRKMCAICRFLDVFWPLSFNLAHFLHIFSNLCSLLEIVDSVLGIMRYFRCANSS